MVVHARGVAMGGLLLWKPICRRSHLVAVCKGASSHLKRLGLSHEHAEMARRMHGNSLPTAASVRVDPPRHAHRRKRRPDWNVGSLRFCRRIRLLFRERKGMQAERREFGPTRRTASKNGHHFPREELVPVYPNAKRKSEKTNTNLDLPFLQGVERYGWRRIRIHSLPTTQPSTQWTF